MDFIAANWPAIVSIAGLYAAIWALSFASLKAIRDSDRADPITKDSAEVAMIAITIVGSIASAAGLGYAFIPSWPGPLFGVLIFAMPFAAALVHYVRAKKKSQ